MERRRKVKVKWCRRDLIEFDEFLSGEGGWDETVKGKDDVSSRSTLEVVMKSK